MNRRGKLGLVTAAMVAVVGVATSASAEYRNTELYREDANAQFVLHHGDCELERSVVEVSFHQDFFRNIPGTAPRNVQFGVAIQEFDCFDQLISVSDGLATDDRPFDIEGKLRSSKVRTTIDVCVRFPSPGSCSAVKINLAFKGVGEIVVDKQHHVVHEPDCVINNLTVAKTRTARVWGSLSFTGPGGEQRYWVSSADLGPFGATLFSDYERIFMKGDGFECTEH